MKFYFSLLLFSLGVQLSAQDNFEIKSEQLEGGFEIRVDNKEHCPISIEFDFDLQNMKRVGSFPKVLVVPARTTDFLAAKLVVEDKYKANRYSYKYKLNYGDASLSKKDTDEEFDYHLPFEAGKQFIVHQGYNGNFSHQGKKAIDFTMPEGTPVCAIREGVVIEIEEENNRSCLEPRCVDLNNYILVYHSDGTFANYAHLKKNGALVEVGDSVQLGEKIGLSGNTGFSNGPHLHLAVYLQGIEKRNTLPTFFRINEGKEKAILKEGVEYKRNY